MTKKFIKKAIKRPGALRKSLDIPEKKTIPMSLLNKIVKAKAGQTISNPTTIGKRRIRVTRRIERQAILARNLKRIRR